jgi:hypothetical protein
VLSLKEGTNKVWQLNKKTDAFVQQLITYVLICVGLTDYMIQQFCVPTVIEIQFHDHSVYWAVFCV